MSVSAIDAVVAPTSALTARTVECEPTGDLLDRLGPEGFAWIRSGVGFVAGGVAARVPALNVGSALADITVHDEVATAGTGAIAVGGLPFLASERATLTIPAWVEGRTAFGTAWRTEIRSDDAESSDAASSDAGPADPSPTGRVTPPVGPKATHFHCLTNRTEWRASVCAALDAIAARSFTKVVLSRCVQVEADDVIDPAWLLGRLARREPDRYLYADAGFVGASPELLIGRAGDQVIARPLAGTEPLAVVDRSLRTLTQSAKQQHEHDIVVRAIADVLASQCQDLEIGAPAVTRLADVAHLITTLRATATPATPSALGLALALHPTPAVGGSPTDRALAFIREWEPVDRGRYAGPVGWVDAHGDGEFAIALRGAAVHGTTALVHAGAGIVAGSEPDAEWTEIDAKLTPVLRALTLP